MAALLRFAGPASLTESLELNQELYQLDLSQIRFPKWLRKTASWEKAPSALRWNTRHFQVHSQSLLNNAWNAKSHWKYHSTGRPPQAVRVVSPIAACREVKSQVVELRFPPHNQYYIYCQLSGFHLPFTSLHVYGTYLSPFFSPLDQIQSLLLWGQSVSCCERGNDQGGQSECKERWLRVYQSAFLQE